MGTYYLLLSLGWALIGGWARIRVNTICLEILCSRNQKKIQRNWIKALLSAPTLWHL